MRNCISSGKFTGSAKGRIGLLRVHDSFFLLLFVIKEKNRDFSHEKKEKAALKESRGAMMCHILCMYPSTECE